MKVITSSENKIYKMCRELLLKKNRTKSGMYLVEGENLVEEAARLKRARIIVTREEYQKQREFSGIETVFMTGKLFHGLTQTETDQGILAAVWKKEPSREEFLLETRKGSGNVLVLDAVQDPGNIGTMIRTAVGAGYRGILATKGTGDIYSPKVVRSAAGALFRIPILTGMTPEDAILLLKEGEKRILGTEPANAVDYREVDLTNNCALIIGNEGNGMSQIFRDNVTENITIPMMGDLESLNAAVAAAILMYRSIEKGN